MSFVSGDTCFILENNMNVRSAVELVKAHIKEAILITRYRFYLYESLMDLATLVQ